MKKQLLGSIAFLITAISHSQSSYNYEDINSQSITKSISATSDNNGNIIVCGTFHESISFGNLSVTNSTPFNSSGQNQYTSYIGKKTGETFQWLTKIDLLPLDRNSLAQINSITADASGNILMTGIFFGKVSFDNIVLTSTIINSPYGPGYSTDMFVAKLSSSGIFQWAKLEGNPNYDCNGNEMGISITTDNLGNVYAAGRLYDKELKGANTCICSVNTPVSSAVIIKYNSAGIKLWDKRYSPTQPSKTDCDPGCNASRVAVDGNNVYLVGNTQGSVKFGNITLNTGSDTRNTFILKLDANGNTSWAKLISNNSNSPNSMVLNNNYLYLIGQFGPGTINFGGPTLTATASNNYMAKYNLSGNCSWATMPGIVSGSLIVNASGNLATLSNYTLKEYSTSNGAPVDSTVASNLQNAKISNAKLAKTTNGYIISESLQGSYDFGGITISSTQAVGSVYSDLVLITYTPTAAPIVHKGNTLPETSPVNNVLLYPNPARNQLTIQNNNNKILGDLSIYDVSGKKIYQKFIGNSQTTIDIKSFSAGFYYLRSDQLQATIKFIKQ